MTTDVRLPPPWEGFLQAVDAELHHDVEIHCFGGFVLTVMWDLSRPTGDVDFLAAAPANVAAELLAIAGAGSPLAKRHGLYLQLVTVSDFPDDYEDRLVDITPTSLSRLRLRALTAEDLILSKLTRNSPKDIHDVRHLAKRGALNPTLLYDRYHRNLRPYLVNVERHDLTLELWLDEIREIAEGELSR